MSVVESIERRLYIDGTWSEGTGASVIDVVNPATEEIVARVPEASEDDIGQAVLAARRAFDDGPWPNLAPRDRSEALWRFHDALASRKSELIELTVTEAGSTQMLGDFLQVQTPLDHLAWWAERAATFPFTEPLPPVLGMGIGQGVVRKEPVGVVAGLTPFNFPIFLNLWKLGPALAMGNACVLKPSPFTPLEAIVLAEAAEAAELPRGVLNVVTGDIEGSKLLTTHPAVDLVSFTGSDAVGKQVMAQASGSLKKVLLELGGKSACLIFPGVDLDRVIPSAAMMGFLTHCGQGCALTTRLVVHKSIHDRVVEKLCEFLPLMSIGDPANPANMIGPLIRESQRERVERYVQLGLDEGAELVYGGARPEGLDKGFFYMPTLFDNVDNKMTIAQEEIFGPVGAVISFSDTDEAIRIANDSRYGLAGAVWHPDPVDAYGIASKLRTGTVTINGGGGGMNAAAPFGGYKHSGVGRELSDHGLHEYLELKTVMWGAGQL